MPLCPLSEVLKTGAPLPPYGARQNDLYVGKRYREPPVRSVCVQKNCEGREISERECVEGHLPQDAVRCFLFFSSDGQDTYTHTYRHLEIVNVSVPMLYYEDNHVFLKLLACWESSPLCGSPSDTRQSAKKLRDTRSRNEAPGAPAM